MVQSDSQQFSFYNFTIVLVSYLASYLLVAKVLTPIQSQYISNSELKHRAFNLIHSLLGKSSSSILVV